MDYQALSNEVSIDPLARGYAGMTDTQVADSLNSVDRSRNRTSMTGSEVFNATDSAEYNALTAEDKASWLSFCGIDSHDPFGTSAAFVSNIFGAGNTVNALIAARVETVSRATELSLSTVKVGDVEYVRR